LHMLVCLDSFGTSYLAPIAPLVPSDLKDAITRQPMFALKNRPKTIPNINATRQGDNNNGK